MPPAITADEESEVMEVLGADVQKRIAHVRDGLRSLLHLLDGRSEAYELTPPPVEPSLSISRKVVPTRGKAPASGRKVIPARGKSNGKRVTRAR